MERREEKRDEFKKVFLNHKTNNIYYDTEKDHYQREGYYLRLKNVDYDSLSQLLSSTWNHARRRQNFFPIIDRHPDHTLRCVYSGEVIGDAEGNIIQKCDEEHSFPQSFQRGKKSGTGRDMHAIFAASKNANGSRGNRPFGLFTPDDKLVEETKYGGIYSSGNNRKTFVPFLNQGALARATLYILVCYKGCANPEYFSKGLINWYV